MTRPHWMRDDWAKRAAQLAHIVLFDHHRCESNCGLCWTDWPCPDVTAAQGVLDGYEQLQEGEQ